MEDVSILKNKAKQIRKLADKYYKQYHEELEKNIWGDKVTLEKLSNKIRNLSVELQDLESQIRVSTSKPAIANEIVDLYQVNKELLGYYDVYLHDTPTLIGRVGCFDMDNNLCCVIDDDYRNKGYAFQATWLLIEHLQLNGIDNVSIRIKYKNAPSLKVAEKLKKVLPDFQEVRESRNNSYVTYKFHLKDKIDEKSVNK